MSTNNITPSQIKEEFNKPNNQIDGVVIDETIKKEFEDINSRLTPIVIDEFNDSMTELINNETIIVSKEIVESIKNKIQLAINTNNRLSLNGNLSINLQDVMFFNRFNIYFLGNYAIFILQFSKYINRYNVNLLTNVIPNKIEIYTSRYIDTITEYNEISPNYYNEVSDATSNINSIIFIDNKLVIAIKTNQLLFNAPIILITASSIYEYRYDNIENKYFLKIIPNDITNKVDKEEGKGLSTHDFTTILKNKLDNLSNYDDTNITNKLTLLENRLNTILNDPNATNVIDTFQEIENFLAGITNTETLTGLLQDLKGEIVALCNNNYFKLDGSNVSENNVNTLINKLSEGSSTPTDSDFYVAQYAGGGNTTKTYHRRPLSALWNWIKSKCDSFYQPKGSYLTSHQSLANYYTKTEAGNTFQPKGNYLTSHQSLANYYNKTESDNKYQAKGNYLTSHQSLANYIGINTTEYTGALNNLTTNGIYKVSNRSFSNTDALGEYINTTKLIIVEVINYNNIIIQHIIFIRDAKKNDGTIAYQNKLNDYYRIKYNNIWYNSSTSFVNMS